MIPLRKSGKIFRKSPWSPWDRWAYWSLILSMLDNFYRVLLIVTFERFLGDWFSRNHESAQAFKRVNRIHQNVCKALVNKIKSLKINWRLVCVSKNSIQLLLINCMKLNVRKSLIEEINNVIFTTLIITYIFILYTLKISLKCLITFVIWIVYFNPFFVIVRERDKK